MKTQNSAGRPEESAQLITQEVASNAPRVVTRHVPVPVQLMLWGMAAGRCEFEGCNKPLWKSSVTQEQVNIGQKAHIYAFSSDGPRGHDGIPAEKLHDLSNLMLVCHECHEKIDQKQDGGRYNVSVLQSMKMKHERRVELVTEIAPNKRSHVVLYGANIGEHSSPLSYASAAQALFPNRYPADDKAIELGMVNSSFVDHDAKFWAVEANNLVSRVNQRVRERLASGEAEHLSIFGLAPQPLLILLGSILTDIPTADVYQLHREPPGWQWPLTAGKTPAFEVREPSKPNGTPALVLALSATITADRIASVIGQEASTWTVTITAPHNDFTKSREQLAEFRTLMRSLCDQIKARHGQTTALHIFPAVSVSMAVELGRIRMPKADMPWKIYDQVNQRGGFVPALSIPLGEQS